MTRLSSPIENLKNHYTVVVIGSGYGGAIAASRLARAGQQVCVLERGKEFQPGEYPDTEVEAVSEMQVDLPQQHIGSRTGLYDFHVNKDINVFVGCGLGGTSLVNANVSLQAEPRVFADPHWPQGLRDDVDTLLAQGYRRAEEMLKPTPYPQDFSPLPKLQALEKSAKYLNENFYRPPINVTFQDGVNHVGVEQKKCNLCGDCVSGCNHKAKNTVLMNYLPDAKNHGAEIYTQVSVRRIERQDVSASPSQKARWLVHYQLLDSGREKFNAPTLFVSADIVILAAGTLGSTEILLRSAAHGLPVSEQLGNHLTGNGDVLAFGYNTDQTINGIGFGSRPAKDMKPVGPCITGIIDMREQPQLDNGMVIEEGSIPGGISSLLSVAFAKAAKLLGKDTDTGFADLVKEQKRELESLLFGPYKGAVKNTQTYLVMTHDDANGRMYLENDRLRIDWDYVGKQPIFERVNNRLVEATIPLGGTQIPNPIWSKLFQKDLITVHPLGGCTMAEDAERGVVNHKGQVFSGSHGTAVHDSFYVCDGSIIPRSLGVNPLLTISAIAERCCALIAKDHGWHINYDLPSTPVTPQLPLRPGIEFTETMRGYFSTQVKEDYQRAAHQGKQDSSEFEFTLTVISHDLEKMLTDENHKARIVGTVAASAISPEALTVSDGEFNLFIIDPEQVNTRRMVYRMKMTAENGKVYYLEGFKVVRDDPGIDLWADTTTLYITVYDGDSIDSPVLGRGILKIQPADFMRQMSTLRITNTDSVEQRLKETARFGRFFAGILFNTYGGIFAPSKVFNADAPPRRKRPLRMAAPQVHFFKTSDGVQLRLTRYQGGTKGPVILAPGFGTSTLAFSIDTVETNLPELLYANNYDVWLFDYRASADLASATTQFSADEIALYDWPAAIDQVRALTGAQTVQVVGHCVGSMSFLMAGLAGLKGVRSAVCSQLTTHPRGPALSEIKAGLRLASFLTVLGVETLTPDFDKGADWQDRLYDKVLKLYPTNERCNSPVCRRILFMYGEVYKHEQLNEATHNAIHEMFGPGNMTFFRHISLILNRGHIVNKHGQDVYLPHLERLAIPIAFIHGAENDFFLPEGSEITYKLLREKNGSDLYVRHVIPHYAHMDCFMGKNAAMDVFPTIVTELDKFNQS
ncbi:alpha/beta fold hydrolase [Brasilonema sp. UFV-L1]|uniref:alpha/beta fold hydrolase n=1 Tax=Brasilonema sp. UFV-L1 TaxID=2234130 RepID=UPI00145EDD32|nr:alpha/beta fold hydrolase [Brasilonema sp. UFV-L1]NMG06504.1 choline dehydrogenase [Brasilonema sp. UFV-L1]